MPDRIIRDELLESDRWLDLPTDASRLAFVGFLLICDDFGNFEGGPRRLYRFLHKFTQIKTEDAATTVIDSLMACDLIRRYQDGTRELFHIPRFKSHRQYLSRAYPPSPWCPKDVELGKDKRIINKGLAKNVVTTSLPRSNDVAEGVGVGVGVGVEKQLLSPRQKTPRRAARTHFPAPFEITPAMEEFARQELGLSPERINSETDKFMDHALANDRICANWKAAWRNWLRKAKEMQHVR